MIRAFYLENKELKWEKNLSDLVSLRGKNIVWVDLQSPSPEEIGKVESAFQVEFQTPQEAEEIESSSRYFEDKNIIYANSSFLMSGKEGYSQQFVSFILKGEVLFTTRNADLRTFAETVRVLKNIRQEFVNNGSEILTILLENRIDLDADYIEGLNRQINTVSSKLLKEKVYHNEILIRIAELQEDCIMLRESINDKQRIVSSLLRSVVIDEEEKARLRVVIKDINSLLQHITFSFERLEYLQNTFLGFVNIEQNQIIKIFTVASVIFMPPTLIASIYGMNFDVMPEKHWSVGYPLAITLMIFSSMLILWYFRRRKWL